MTGKSTVSTLQEYCAKNKVPPPCYEYIEEENGSFCCKITFMDTEAIGMGRSKRDAKHNAAGVVIKRLKLSDVCVDDLESGLPPTDMIIRLRDYCVQHQIPLPIFEIVQQAGTPDAPEFTALCSVASIRRYGVSDKKKDARQKAAYEMFRVIVDDVNKLDHQMQIVSTQTAHEDIESQRYLKFKSYRELTELGSGEIPGVLLCDRHNYFKNFYTELKNNAQKILTSTSYDSQEEQALDVLEALKIKPKVSPLITEKNCMLFIELNCDFDVVFVGPSPKVYSDIIEYFKVML